MREKKVKSDSPSSEFILSLTSFISTKFLPLVQTKPLYKHTSVEFWRKRSPSKFKKFSVRFFLSFSFHSSDAHDENWRASYFYIEIVYEPIDLCSFYRNDAFIRILLCLNAHKLR